MNITSSFVRRSDLSEFYFYSAAVHANIVSYPPVWLAVEWCIWQRDAARQQAKAWQQLIPRRRRYARRHRARERDLQNEGEHGEKATNSGPMFMLASILAGRRRECDSRIGRGSHCCCCSLIGLHYSPEFWLLGSVVLRCCDVSCSCCYHSWTGYCVHTVKREIFVLWKVLW